MLTLKNIVSFVAAGLFILFVWEYVAIVQNTTVCPSTALVYVADKVQQFWKTLGIWTAWISSFLTLISLDNVYKAFWNCAEPVWNILTSCVYFLIGYVSQMNLYDHPYVVLFGSALILASIGGMLYYFDKYGWITSRINNIKIGFEFINNPSVAMGSASPNVCQMSYSTDESTIDSSSDGELLVTSGRVCTKANTKKRNWR